MANDQVKIQIEVATSAAEAALKKFKTQTDSNTSAFNIFKGTFAAGFAVDALKGALSTVTQYVGLFVEEAKKAAQSVTNMEIALKQAGLYTPEVSKSFQALGDELERTTIYSGDMAESAVALFANLNNLTANGIEKATRASADLAATLGIDMATASDMLAKAINGNYTAFKKMGIEIEKGSTDTERLTNITNALASQHGTAAAQANTYAGAMTQLDSAQGKLFESFGKIIVENESVIKGIKSARDTFISLAEWVDRNSKSIAAVGEALYTVFTETLASMFPFYAAIIKINSAWDELRARVKLVQAEILELSSVAALFFDNETAAKLKAQSDAYRQQAKDIRDVIAAKEAEANVKPVDPEELNKKKKVDEDAENARYTAKEKLAIAQKSKADLSLVEQERLLTLEELERAHQENMLVISGESSALILETQLANDQTNLANRQAFEQASLQATIDAENARVALIKDADDRLKAQTDANNKASLAKAKLASKQEIDIKKQQVKTDEEVEKLKVNNRKDTFATIATLSESSNNELAAIGKAFALYQIGVDTAQGVTKALGSAPPPFNFVLAGLVGAAGAVQASKVAGLNFAQGGIVPGNSYRGDKVQANVNSSEMIINRQQQKQLFEIANGRNSNQNNSQITELINAINSRPVSIQIDGKEVFSAVKSQIASGRSL